MQLYIEDEFFVGDCSKFFHVHASGRRLSLYWGKKYEEIDKKNVKNWCEEYKEFK